MAECVIKVSSNDIVTDADQKLIITYTALLCSRIFLLKREEKVRRRLMRIEKSGLIGLLGYFSVPTALASSQRDRRSRHEVDEPDYSEIIDLYL